MQVLLNGHPCSLASFRWRLQHITPSPVAPSQLLNQNDFKNKAFANTFNPVSTWKLLRVLRNCMLLTFAIPRYPLCDETIRQETRAPWAGALEIRVTRYSSTMVAFTSFVSWFRVLPPHLQSCLGLVVSKPGSGGGFTRKPTYQERMKISCNVNCTVQWQDWDIKKRKERRATQDAY